jgi:hypothetical protein
LSRWQAAVWRLANETIIALAAHAGILTLM